MVNTTCISTLGVTWCSIAYVLAGLSFLELLATGYQVAMHIKLFRIFMNKVLAILYIQLLQTIFMFVHYMIIDSAFDILFLIMIYLQFVENTLVFYYFAGEASKMKKGKMYNIMGISLLIANISYLTGYMIYIGIASGSNEDIYDCTNGIWIYLRASGLVLTVLFFILGVRMAYELKILKQNSLMINTSREKELWFLILIVLFGNIVAMVQTMIQVLTPHNNCVVLFSSASLGINIFLFLLIRFMSQDIFNVYCLYVFWAGRRDSSAEESGISLPIDDPFGSPIMSHCSKDIAEENVDSSQEISFY
ncbi:unnamed protein product [Blepharisma stoltei]|uniref:Uncharacterized protein n=1 Tax=Blepharisma stoltei TaxID=1481888 RepID=A0AAU9JXA6_9CILI|nr:unnamed protein product [Blepharisma stoltei]